MRIMDYLVHLTSENESSDEEFLKPAFPVVETEDDYLDDSKRYLDPNNYLLYVRGEAAKYPATLAVPVPRNSDASLENELDDNDDNEENNQSKRVSAGEDTSMKLFLRDFPKTWLQSQARNFTTSQKQFRFAVDVFLPSKLVKSTSHEIANALYSKSIPNWLLDNPVKLSHFIDLPQDKLSDLLEELIPECSPNEWRSDLQAWLYAALLALEKPLHPNTCSLLRNIAEQFCEHLKECKEGLESKEKRFCYVMLSIIGIAFGQRDIIENL